MKPKRPRDTNQLAKMIVDLTTGDETEPKLNVKQVAGRLGGLKGGKARAAKLTPDERSAIAKKAAEARKRQYSRTLAAAVGLLSILVFALSARSQAPDQLPIQGSISEIHGKTKYYLNAPAQDAKLIVKELKRNKQLGLIQVNKPEDAEFVIEYRNLDAQMQNVGIGTLQIKETSGQMDVYLYRDGRKVVVWSDGKTASFSLRPPLALPRRFLKAMQR